MGCVPSNQKISDRIYGEVWLILNLIEVKKTRNHFEKFGKAKFRSMSFNVAELSSLTGLFKELGDLVVKLVDLYCDSKAAIQIEANPTFQDRTKHINIDCHFVRKKLRDGLVKTHHINTKEQPADVFIKGLRKEQHHHLLSKLGVKNVFLPSSLRGMLTPMMWQLVNNNQRS